MLAWNVNIVGTVSLNSFHLAGWRLDIVYRGGSLENAPIRNFLWAKKLHSASCLESNE